MPYFDAYGQHMCSNVVVVEMQEVARIMPGTIVESAQEGYIDVAKEAFDLLMDLYRQISVAVN